MSQEWTRHIQWRPLGAHDPKDMEDARLQAHWASQIVCAAARTFKTPASDDSHTNLGWDAAAGALQGHRTDAGKPFQTALQPGDLALMFFDDAGAAREELALSGLTMDDAYAWLAKIIAAHGGGSAPFDKPDYEMPDHPVARGAAFSRQPPQAFAELANWFANADSLIRAFTAGIEGASPVRCWPHHFDIASLITLDPGADPEQARSIGIGLSPGDEGCSEPYWYVNMWPYPPADTPAPHLPYGMWRTEGWPGGMLTASALLAAGPAEKQAERAAAFVQAAHQACRALL